MEMLCLHIYINHNYFTRDMKVRWGRMVTAYIENGIAVSRFMPFLRI